MPLNLLNLLLSDIQIVGAQIVDGVSKFENAIFVVVDARRIPYDF